MPLIGVPAVGRAKFNPSAAARLGARVRPGLGGAPRHGNQGGGATAEVLRGHVLVHEGLHALERLHRGRVGPSLGDVPDAVQPGQRRNAVRAVGVLGRHPRHHADEAPQRCKAHAPQRQLAPFPRHVPLAQQHDAGRDLREGLEEEEHDHVQEWAAKAPAVALGRGEDGEERDHRRGHHEHYGAQALAQDGGRDKTQEEQVGRQAQEHHDQHHGEIIREGPASLLAAVVDGAAHTIDRQRREAQAMDVPLAGLGLEHEGSQRNHDGASGRDDVDVLKAIRPELALREAVGVGREEARVAHGHPSRAVEVHDRRLARRPGEGPGRSGRRGEATIGTGPGPTAGRAPAGGAGCGAAAVGALLPRQPTVKAGGLRWSVRRGGREGSTGR
mmetsp:Transcript_20427/g.69411  ORF Transcript_20427/g.69411 Transcript_20427/m.69411 type:complete len:386 (+) Transcript_20427:88-1245(+)